MVGNGAGEVGKCFWLQFKGHEGRPEAEVGEPEPVVGGGLEAEARVVFRVPQHEDGPAAQVPTRRKPSVGEGTADALALVSGKDSERRESECCRIVRGTLHCDGTEQHLPRNHSRHFRNKRDLVGSGIPQAIHQIGFFRTPKRFKMHLPDSGVIGFGFRTNPHWLQGFWLHVS